MDQTALSRTAFDMELSALDGAGIDTATYQRLCGITLDHPDAPTLLASPDPFSIDYRDLVLRLYYNLRGRQIEGYLPSRDELSGSGIPKNVWNQTPPWSFKDPGFVGEFLYSYGHILKLLALPSGSRARVLEYGPGSGQLLLMLARMDVQAYAVDVDQTALDLVRRQAEAMDISVETERAEFGEGFGDQRFDRVVFFEAFHHAIDWIKLLRRLHQRLTPGGKLILCGEPVVPDPTLSVPYPWGPRLDALSIYCMRKYGWMELGFTRAFLNEALWRSGWSVTFHAFPGCGRADAWVAEPMVLPTTLRVGEDIYLGGYAKGWHEPEGTHRWTRGVAGLPLPDLSGIRADVTLRLGNYLPIAKTVTVTGGDRPIVVTLGSGETGHIVHLGTCSGKEIEISCRTHRISEFAAGALDKRDLGIAVEEISMTSDGMASFAHSAPH